METTTTQSTTIVSGRFTVKTISNVEAFGRGPLRHNGNYMLESFAMPEHAECWHRERGHWRAAVERYAQSVTQMDRPVVWITDNWSCGYFHWVCDALPRLELASRSCDLSSLTLLLPYKYRKHSYMQQSLQPYGLKEVRCLRRFERAFCQEMVFPSHVKSTGNYDESIIADMRVRFTRFLADNPNIGSTQSADFGDRIYISRSRANKRRVKNENEILPVLRNHGFDILVAEEHDWFSQTRVVSKAKYLVSNHGAGLTNMLVMAPGSHAMEILEEIPETPRCYDTLASVSNLHYVTMPCTRINPRQCVHHGDVTVDPKQLDAAIASMLGG